MNIERLRQMVAARTGALQPSFAVPNIIPEDANQDVLEYFKHLLPAEIFVASGVRVKTTQGIEEENSAEVAPGGFIAPFGFVVIATSVGGNAVCVDCHTGATYWADRSSFTEEDISFEDRSTGAWVDFPFSPENIPKALVPIEYSLEVFLERLLTDDLETLFDELD